MDPTQAAIKGVHCPCGRCHRPSDPFTPYDLPNFGKGKEGLHLEGRIAATAVALAATKKELTETEAEFDKINSVYLVEALDRAEKAEAALKDLKQRLDYIAKNMRAHAARITVTSGTRWVLNIIQSAADRKLKDWKERGERPLTRKT